MSGNPCRVLGWPESRRCQFYQLDAGSNQVRSPSPFDVIDWARFDSQKIFLEQVSAPPPEIAPMPDERRRFLPEPPARVVDALSV